MRIHHNKLYYGKYQFKNIFKMPWAGILYPTTDQKLLEMIQGKDKSVRYLNTKWYKTSPDVIKLAQAMSFQQRNLIITDREEVLTDYLRKADIVTNSGHMRPLDKKKLMNLKQNTVIPLMYESWEFRKTDIDLAYCKEKSILVAGTNERHPDINIFNYLGPLIAKVLLNSSMEIIENKYLIVCDNSCFIGGTMARLNCPPSLGSFSIKVT